MVQRASLFFCTDGTACKVKPAGTVSEDVVCSQLDELLLELTNAFAARHLGSVDAVLRGPLDHVMKLTGLSSKVAPASVKAIYRSASWTGPGALEKMQACGTCAAAPHKASNLDFAG